MLASATPYLPTNCDALAEFGGKVTLNGLRTWSNGTFVITFSNLIPSRRYSFALHGDSGSPSQTSLWANVRIVDVADFWNSSSTGIIQSTFAMTNDSARLPAANTNGLLVRYTEISPGADGDFAITIAASGSALSGAYVNGFSLTALPISEQLPAGSDWTYLDNGTDQPSSWRTNFHSNAWPSGPSPLGYGNAGSVVSNIVATLLQYGPSNANKYITYYFRKAVVLDAVENLASNLTFRARIDDGCALYINGARVWTNNVPDLLSYTNLAVATIGSGAETNLLSFTVPRAAFVSGTNWLSVEVHQAAPDSSDILFDLSAEGLLSRGFLFSGSGNQATQETESAWIAYNDLSWADSQIDYRITKLSFVDDSDHNLSGTLIRYGDGESSGVTLSCAGASGAGLWVTTNQGAPNAGTPGYLQFNGKVDMNRTVFVASTNAGTLTLSGLNPARRYRVALLGNRAEPTYSNRTTVITLAGADSFTNSSSAGALITGAASETTTITTGTNTGGLVFQYTGIAAGSDGEIVLNVVGGAGNPFSWYLNAMLLELLPDSGGDADSDGMLDSWEQLYFGGTSQTNAGSSDDWDQDGFNNYSEYRAGTDPTSTLSRLEFTGLAQTNLASGMVLTWSSVAGKSYAILASSNLLSPMQTLLTGIPASPPINVYTTTVAGTRRFIRIQVE